MKCEVPVTTPWASRLPDKAKARRPDGDSMPDPRPPTSREIS